MPGELSLPEGGLGVPDRVGASDGPLGEDREGLPHRASLPSAAGVSPHPPPVLGAMGKAGSGESWELEFLKLLPPQVNLLRRGEKLGRRSALPLTSQAGDREVKSAPRPPPAPPSSTQPQRGSLNRVVSPLALVLKPPLLLLVPSLWLTLRGSSLRLSLQRDRGGFQSTRESPPPK